MDEVAEVCGPGEERHRTRFMDLFCGMGSFTRAFIEVGARCVGACDIAPSCRKAYEHIYHIVPAADVRKMAIDPALPECDVLCAGFPCQPFSIAGKREGTSCDNGNLWRSVLDIAKRSRPLVLLLENVRGLMSIDDGRTFHHILEEFNFIGYRTTHVVLRATKFGLPQNRTRVFIVGLDRDWADSRGIEMDKEFAKVDDGHAQGCATLADFLSSPQIAVPYCGTITTHRTNKKYASHGTWNIVSTMDGGIYNISVEESLALQGFERDLDFGPGVSTTAKVKMIGNTIPTPFTRTLAAKCAEILARPPIKQ